MEEVFVKKELEDNAVVHNNDQHFNINSVEENMMKVKIECDPISVSIKKEEQSYFVYEGICPLSQSVPKPQTSDDGPIFHSQQGQSQDNEKNILLHKITEEDGNNKTKEARKSEVKKPHFCLECTYSTPKRFLLTQHIQSVHKKVRPHPCPHCSYRASEKSTLKQHIVAIHTCEKRHQCPLCTYKAAHRGSLNQHVRIIHQNERPHTCNQCDYRTSKKATLMQHITSIHTYRRDHLCNLCSYRTSRKNSLVSHIKSVHWKLKPYGCSKCSYKSSRRNDVTRHVKMKHKNSTIDSM